MMTRHSTDIESVIREHEGYVPSNDLQEEEAVTSSCESNGMHYLSSDQAYITKTSTGPSIIPLNVHRVVDIEGVGISERELMGHAFINSITDASNSQADFTERYAYQRGSRFVNEYGRTDADGAPYEGDPDNPNHLLGCFPTLFPYGRGGFETNRPVKVVYERHIKWALCSHNRQ